MTSSVAVYQDDVELLERPVDKEALGSVFPVHRVIVQLNNSQWTKELKSKLNELTSLRVGWDGYKGQPVSYTRAAFAAAILDKLYVDGISVPSLVPGGDGTLQIEWHCNNFDIEIDILDANSVVASKYDHVTNTDEELVIKSDFTKVWGWLLAMVERQGIQQH